MKRWVSITLIFLLLGQFTYGQGNPITEFDLYGCWVLERYKRESGLKNSIYLLCQDAGRAPAVRNSAITFLSDNKCEFKAIIQDALCPIIYKTVEGTWTYDKKSRILEIYYPKDFKKEFWDKVKEDYPDIEIPNPMSKAKFRIVQLSENQLEVEKLYRKKSKKRD